MKRVEKKIWSEYFNLVLSGDKTFELRLNDFEIEKGDILVLKEWDKDKQEYTGRELEREVGYVGRWKLEDLDPFWSREEVQEKGL